MSDAGDAIDAVQRLVVPQGRMAGELVRLGAFQRRFIEGALAEAVNVACMSVARGNGKTSLAAALAVTHLFGAWGAQPQREVAATARTRDQAQVMFNFARSFVEAMPEIGPVTIRKNPILEIEVEGPGGPHRFKALASTGKAAFGGSATLAILDERAAWMDSRGAEMEAALLTSLGKRDGRALIISTSAPTDMNDFSKWLDHPPTGCYVQEHRAPEGLPLDDWPSLALANPGHTEGIGADKGWLLAAARQAAERGGAAVAAFRNLHRNERCNIEARAVLMDPDAWMHCEVEVQPERAGPCTVGLDLGGPSSMTCMAAFWPYSGRLEVLGWFPGQPGLGARGVNDGCGRRYLDMASRGELRVLGERTVPTVEWVGQVLAACRT